MTNSAEQRYLKTGAAATYLGVSRRWLTQLADEGKIPFAQVGTRTRLFSLEDISSWINSNKVGGGA